LDAEERGYKKAQSEIARLREALENILRSKYGEYAEDIAREALKCMEIAIHAGWEARDGEIKKLEAENARLKEALEHIATLGNMFEEKASAQVASEALKGIK
jgi:predicted nuclease with TOPRIM domain